MFLIKNCSPFYLETRSRQTDENSCYTQLLSSVSLLHISSFFFFFSPRKQNETKKGLRAAIRPDRRGSTLHRGGNRELVLLHASEKRPHSLHSAARKNHVIQKIKHDIKFKHQCN